MAEQPTDMAGMVRSVMDTHRALTTVLVIPTIATHVMAELSTPQRAALQAYLTSAQAVAMGTIGEEPGKQVTINQTDEWYRTHDHKGGFATLVGHVQVVSQRTR